nr:uncharacterized protein LOC111427697 [Onthophagus taurus]
MTNPLENRNWDEFEGRLLRVLNYKYYERDMKTLYHNAKYKDGKTQSDPYMVEGVMQTIIYDEYDDSRRPIDIIRTTLPTRQQPQVVFVRGRLCRNFFRFWWNVVTFKFCRSRQPRVPTTPRLSVPTD